MGSCTPSQLYDLLLHVAPVRPVYVKGPPGGGKSAIIQKFADDVGLDLVVREGSKAAPEDVNGVPQIINGKTVFAPPAALAREEPYCLFLDEFPNASIEVQKSFYSLVHEKRTESFTMPKGSIVIAAGNRLEDNAFVEKTSTALSSRVFQVELVESVPEWLDYALENGFHPWVIDYIRARPRHLRSNTPASDEPFSCPRTWHALSDSLLQYQEDISDEMVLLLAEGWIKQAHAVSFASFVKQIRGKFDVPRLLKGEISWPDSPKDIDLLFFLAHSFREHLARELPADRNGVKGKHQELAHQAKGLLKTLARINFEIAQKTIAGDTADDSQLPSWFMAEVVRDLPRLTTHGS